MLPLSASGMMEWGLGACEIQWEIQGACEIQSIEEDRAEYLGLILKKIQSPAVLFIRT